MSLPMWAPDEQRIAHAPITRFRELVNHRYQLDIKDYKQLHQWSIDSLADFWRTFWDFADIQSETQGERVIEHTGAMPGARFFPDAKLNYTSNLLRRNDDGIAIMFRGEDGTENNLSYRELNQQVASVARALHAEGVVAGDRVAGFVPNVPEAIVAMLASASLGAVWSSCSPDFGINGVLDRFGQIEPKVLFTADGYRYNGRVHDSLSLISELAPKLKGLRRIFVIDFVGAGDLHGPASEMVTSFAAIANDGSDEPLHCVALPFDHPLYIMFSSGTTGKPKCIVHSAGGVLLQHLKEHQLHVGLEANEKLFFFSTCGWMMWNWLVSGLASNATVMLYDGSPFYPNGNVLFDYAQDSGMHYLGTSAKFIDACSKANIEPRKTHQLPSLKSILSTGSPLVPESFDYVYERVSEAVCLSSMSGGTDILGCFALGNPTLPVYRGELQCIGLAMDVQAFSDEGAALPTNHKGELVCVKPFPSMPIGFFKDDDGSRYHDAYFARFNNVWCHGDYVSISEHAGMIIFGRSDAVLNPGGVRIGTAEIYRQVEQFDDVLESLVIGQQWQGDVRVILFVRLRDGVQLEDALIKRIQSYIREQTTPRHVPAKVVQVSDIPRTRSGKIVELAVRKIVHGDPVDNVEALANPEALALFSDLPALAE